MKAPTAKAGRVFIAVAYLLFCYGAWSVLVPLTAALRLCRFVRGVRRVHRWLGMGNRVIYLAAYHPGNAGYKYRVEKWVEVLNANDYPARSRYVLDRARFDQLTTGPLYLFHTVFLLLRLTHCVESLCYGTVIVRRELLLYNDYGWLFMERFLLAWHPNVVLDFDDDLSADKREPRRVGLFGRLLFECPTKFRTSVRLYRRFIAGSAYLGALVREANPRVGKDAILLCPTCVDYDQDPPKVYPVAAGLLTFGWVGSTGNLTNLDLIIPALSHIAERHPIRLVVISGRAYTPPTSFPIINVSWDPAREITDLYQIDIGLMPLSPTTVNKGKCGFKLLQYMGLGIVSVATAVTANEEIVSDGRDGFLVRGPEQWLPVLRRVIALRQYYARIGAAARAKVRDRYSFSANATDYIDFIRAGQGNRSPSAG